jgi:predicted nucleic acid-binding protein
MSMRWIVDTSAWSRRDLSEVNAQLNDILGEHGDSVFVLSPAVLLELLRGPQNDEVAVERKTLTETMELLPADAKTFELAADAMEVLATHSAEAHRLPLADLITAALAHQHGCGVIHLDEDFEELAQHSGLSFDQRRIALPGEDPEGGSGHPVADRQRALKRELARLLHQKPVSEAEEFLELR